MVRILVLAGNFEQFKHYVAEHKKTGYDYRYVSGAHSAHGAYFDNYAICGSFWKRKDAGELFDEVSKRHEIFMEMRRNFIKNYYRGRKFYKLLMKLFWALLSWALIILIWRLFI